MAPEIVTPAPPAEGFKFRGEEVRRRHEPNLQIRQQLVFRCGVHRGAVPAIRESKNLLIKGHDVENNSRLNPPAQRRSFARIFRESERAKTFAKFAVLRI